MFLARMMLAVAPLPARGAGDDGGEVL